MVAFVVELALFGGVGAIAFRAAGGDGPGGWPPSPRPGSSCSSGACSWHPSGRLRLGTGARVLLSGALCVGTAYGLIAADWPGWGWFVGLAGLVVVAAQVVLPTAPRDGG